MRISKRFLITLAILIEAITLGIVVPSTLSYYRIVRIESETTAEIQSALLALDVSGCEDLNLLNAVPGDEITCTLRVTNTTNKSIKYNYVLEDNINNFERKDDLVYTVTKNGELKKNETYPSVEREIISHDNCLGPKGTDTYTITVKYLKTRDNQIIDQNKEVSAKIGARDIKFVDSCSAGDLEEEYFTLTIDPNGGIYNGTTDKTVATYKVGSLVTLEALTPPEGFKFIRWNASNDKTYTEQVLIEENITLVAIWEQIAEPDDPDEPIQTDAVCYIKHPGSENNYQKTIQLCNDLASNGDMIVMVKSTTESPNMNKQVTLNLNGFTITGTVSNVNNLTVIGEGSIISDNIAINNTGTLTLGEDDGIVSITYPHIEGDINGVYTSDTFNFYDGILIGNKAFKGLVTAKPEGYYVFVDYDEINDLQKAWLVPDFHTKAICRIKDVLYFNFQNAIDADDKDTIIFIRDAELAYDIEFYDTENRVVDLDGYTISNGYTFLNNGILKMKNSKNPDGSWYSSTPIINNNKLTFEDFIISQTTNTDAVNNNGDITLINSSIIGKDSIGINNIDGNIDLDENSEIKFKCERCSYSNKFYGVKCMNGNITGSGKIHALHVPEGGNCTVDGPQFVNSISYIEAMYVEGTLVANNGTLVEDLNGQRWNNFVVQIVGRYANMTVNNLEYHNNNSTSLYVFENNGTLTLNGGTYETNKTFLRNRLEFYRVGTFGGYNRGYTTVNNVNFNGNQFLEAYADKRSDGVIINDANVTCTGPECIVIREDAIHIDGGNFTCDNKCVTDYESYSGRDFTSKLIMTGGTLHAINDNAIQLDKNYISGGTIISDNGYGIYDYNTSSTIGTSIGTKDGDPNPDSLKIIGSSYGLYSDGGYVEIFDGTLYGGIAGTNIEPDLTETGYVLESDTKNYNGTTYNIKYLDVNKPFLSVDGDGYNSFNDAIAAAKQSSSKTITLVKNNRYTDPIIFDADDLIFDLNGYKLETTQSLVIDSGATLTINDSSNNNSGELSSNAINTIRSNGTVIINGGTFSSTYPDSSTGALYGSNYTINDGIFNGPSKVTKNYCSNISVYGNSVINGGLFNNIGDNCAVKVGSPTVEIKGGEYHSSIVAAGGTEISNVKIINEDEENSSGITGGSATIRNSIIHVKKAALVVPGTYHLYDNDIISENSYAYSVTGSLTQHSGSAKALNSYAIYFYDFYNEIAPIYSSRLYILGGTIESTNSSVMDVRRLPLQVQIQIGEDHDTPTNNPVLIGKNYVFDRELIGTMPSYAQIYYYDGVLKAGNIISTKDFYETIKTNYIFDDSTEIIAGETYNVRKLKPAGNIVSVNGVEYKSISDAVNNIPTNGETTTMTLLTDAETNDKVTFKEGQNIKFDLNGHLFSNTSTWQLKGDLDITNTSSDPGTFKIVRRNVFELVGNDINLKLYNINISEQNIEKDYDEELTFEEQYNAHIVDSGRNNVLINNVNYVTPPTPEGSTFKHFCFRIYRGHGNVSINNSNFDTCSGFVMLNNANFNMSESYYKVKSGTIYLYSGATGNIYKSTLERTSQSAGNIIYNQNEFTISESVMLGTGTIANYKNITMTDTTVDVDNPNIGELNGRTSFLGNVGTANIINSNIKTHSLIGIVNSSNNIVNFKSGSLESTGTYAIRNTGSTLNIGDSETNLDNTNPSIKGKNIGIYNSDTGIVNFYDGIIKGQAKAIEGAYTTMYAGTMLESDTEIINEEDEDRVYQIDYLIPAKKFIQNGSNKYKSISEALSEASSGDTLTFIENVNLNEEVSIPDELEITFDFNGKNVSFSKTITNNGTLYWKDENNTSNVSFKLISNNIPLIINNHSLYINGGVYTAPYFIESNGNYLEIKNINYETVNNVNVVNIKSGTFKIENSTFTNNYPTGISSETNAIIRVATNNGDKLASKNQIINSNFIVNAEERSDRDTSSTPTSFVYNSNEDLEINDSTFYARVSFSDTEKNIKAVNTVFNLRRTGESVSVPSNVTFDADNVTFYSPSIFRHSGTFATQKTYDMLNVSGKLIATKITFKIDNYGDDYHLPYRCLVVSNSGTVNINEINIDNLDSNRRSNDTTGVHYASVGVSNINTLNVDFLNTVNYDSSSSSTTKNFIGVYTNSTGTLNIGKANINISGNDKTGRVTKNCGIYNEGDINLIIDNANININNPEKGFAYGIYNVGIGEVTILNGSIDVTSNLNYAYGVYSDMTGGSVTIGKRGDGYDPDRILVRAVSTSSQGIGVKKVNGYFNFYDGTIVGSTNAKPDTTSLVEYDHEAIFYRGSDDYEYCILDYLSD